MAAVGLLDELYAHVFSGYCTSVAHALDIERELAELPVDADEVLRARLRRLLIQQRKLCLQLGEPFGLTPAARLRVVMSESKPRGPSPWDDF